MMLGVDYIDDLCKVLHDAYETAAIVQGWNTNPESQKPWVDVPEANKATMRYAVTELLIHIAKDQESLKEHYANSSQQTPSDSST
jgi:hypothetical protein